MCCNCKTGWASASTRKHCAPSPAEATETDHGRPARGGVLYGAL
jgi:hypothetical protein